MGNVRVGVFIFVFVGAISMEQMSSGLKTWHKSGMSHLFLLEKVSKLPNGFVQQSNVKLDVFASSFRIWELSNLEALESKT